MYLEKRFVAKNWILFVFDLHDISNIKIIKLIHDRYLWQIREQKYSKH